ncbi:hypothetical protein [Allorhizobium taibaishanense]|uniref:Uncharacterized protein n=1 Tax=Allorhizobium taibaishanense TaxID=887144 RepID=A0A1Q9A4J7_9HYPH|nr:hypothetical protein [Allorhizobium taibaishanense]MBB4006570.1 hypothetical protein [Allorhizobium taibaishanense]OLP49495.1 hypothetical protein BJF91_20915 [Allorhizobium taibaishanense]
MSKDLPTGTETLAADLRRRCETLSAKLDDAASPQQDAALRAEIADIAAGMIVLTARSEGKDSPIPSLLAKAAPGSAASDASGDDVAQPLRDRIKALAPDLLGD